MKNRKQDNDVLNQTVEAVRSTLDEATNQAWVRKIRRVIILILGGTVLLVGVAFLVLPGPAFLVIPAGLSILAIEFAWARRWMRKARQMLPGDKWNPKGKSASDRKRAGGS